ncbi:MAG: succinylglutamate desuccinylase/aspartoacylase family protein [Magnetococcales bacterium]|nr:succinylglutamate desuccinylase/aspartoacylase family protein [Magnetococcales bacterium]MBF0434179.1 succinylglutamate desuccinylase/aspartoacylase family protein [Magnetococcales bacterium]
MLTVLDHVPEGLLTVPPTDLHRVLSGPTLCHLDGVRPEPLFVSVLLHGNETTGLLAVQELLQRHQGQRLPRALSLLIGNIAAARHEQRHLHGQPDYNRIWCGEGGDEFAMAQVVLQEMIERRVFAAVDVHNNSAPNPHYAIVTRLDPPSLKLARLFSDQVVFSTQPNSMQSSAFGEVCPAVTIECGIPGDPAGTQRSRLFLQHVLELGELPLEFDPEEPMTLYRIVATITIPEGLSFGFAPGEGEALVLSVDPPRQNFQVVAKGTVWGTCSREEGHRFRVTDENHRDVFARYFVWEEGRIKAACDLIPAMLTWNHQIIRQDCLGYLLERVRYFPLPEATIIDQRVGGL